MQRFLIFILAILALPCCVFAQDPTTGLPPYGSFDRNGFDTVNLQNLNVNFPLSVVSMRERAGAFSFAVVYDSLVWKNVGSAWTPVTDPSGTPTWGWKKDQVVGSVSYTSAIRYCRILNPPETARHYWNFAYTDSQGTRHSFNIDFYDTPTSCNWPIDPTNGYATDGGGYFMEALLVPSVQVWNSKGIDVTNGGVRKDPNGNFVSKIIVSSTETDWKDTANHTALIVKNVSNTEIDYQYYNTAGTLQTYVLRLQTFSIKTNFACSGVVEYTGSAYLPTELDVPNGQSYTFTYEDTPGFTGYKSGRLKRVTLPTGGYYEYRYPTTGNLGINCSDGTTTNLTRVISSDGTAQAEVNWTFARTGISGQAGTTTMTAPTLPYDSAGNQTVVQFDSNGHETSRFIYQGNSTVLRTINTVWAANGTPATTTTTLEDNQTKNQAETTYDTNGNLLTLKEHDWGTGSPGAVVRTTNYAYLTDSSYVAKHILDRVKQVTVADSTGAVKSRRDIAYDEPGYVNLPCVTGAAQHDDANYSCTFSVRGNPTTTTTYTDAATPSGSILHHSYYDNLGNVVTADLDCCQQEQWSYSATTNYAYPDSVVRGSSPGTQLTSSATYNSYTGLVATTKDENNQVYAYSYDAMKRSQLCNALTLPN